MGTTPDDNESSTDRNQDTAQQVVVSQKLVFEELKTRLGDKGHRVLLVEDNKIRLPASFPERTESSGTTIAFSKLVHG